VLCLVNESSLHYKKIECVFSVSASVLLGFASSTEEYHFSLSCYSMHLLVCVSAVFLISIWFEFVKVVTKLELTELPRLHKPGRC